MKSDQITTILFSRNRPLLLAQAISRLGENIAPLVVCDGSDRPLRRDQIRNCEYLHRPNASIWARISEGISTAITPSVVLTTDDDRVLMSTLFECASFLADCTTATRACGTTTHVIASDSDLSRAIPDLQVERVLDLRNPKDAVERFEDMHSQSPQVFYSVIRTRVAQPLAQALAPVPDNASLLAEYLWTVLPSLSGGTYLLDVPMNVRTIARKRPIYSNWRSAFEGTSCIQEWEGWESVKEGLRHFASEIEVSQKQICTVIGLIEQDNWVFPRRVSSNTKYLTAERLRALMGRVRYLTAPRALFLHDERVVSCGLARRQSARCTAYPWLNDQLFDSAKP